MIAKFVEKFKSRKADHFGGIPERFPVKQEKPGRFRKSSENTAKENVENLRSSIRNMENSPDAIITDIRHKFNKRIRKI